MTKPLLALALALAVATPAAAQTPVALSFADAVQRATQTAPAVQIAGFRTEAARSRVRVARGYVFPTLAASSGWLNRTFNRHSLGIEFPVAPGGTPFPDLIGPFDVFDARLSLNQAILDFAGRARLRAAQAAASGSAAEGTAAAEQAALTAAIAYLRAERAAAVLDARRADSALAAELVSLARAQNRAGVSPDIDVTRAEAQQVAAAGGLVVARNQLARSHIDLARALGLDPATPVQVTDSLQLGFPLLELPVGRDSVVRLALVRRPDLQVVAAGRETAQRQQSAIAAERLPRLDVAADAGVNGQNVDRAITTRQIGVQVTLPILDGFRREGRLAEQRAAVREADIRHADLAQQIAADVDAALLDVTSANTQVAIALEGLRLAGAEVSQARERFAAGVAGNIEVINAQVSLVRARDADIDARFAAAAARVALARAAGVVSTLR
jgi:outer membrane protein TolC